MAVTHHANDPFIGLPDSNCTRWPRQEQPCHKLMPSEPHAWCQPCTDWVEMAYEIGQHFAEPEHDWTEGPCEPMQHGGCTGAPHRTGCIASNTEQPD